MRFKAKLKPLRRRCMSAALSLVLGLPLTVTSSAYAATYEEYPSIRLRSLDKITARTLTFDAQVGSTIKFGDIFIKIQSCRKPPPVEKTEAAAFLQIWQVDKIKNTAEKSAESTSRWIYSGWMFASTPALAGMDHPVYDVWVIDCLGKDPEAIPEPAPASPDGALPDEGTVPDGSAPIPTTTPEDQQALPTTTENTDSEAISLEQKEPLSPTSPDDTPQNGSSSEGSANSPEPSIKPQDENIDGIY